MSKIAEQYKQGSSVKRSHLAREIVETLALTLLIFLVVHMVIQSYHVDGTSMEPGLNSQEYVLVNKAAFLFHAPERGDIIVFHYPHDTTQDYIKRIIGLPGDTIQIDSTHVWVDGQLLNEPYISMPANPFAKIWKVPSDDYFVMGDNRQVSDDSRWWGFVPKDFIVGKAVLVYWPTNDIEFIKTYPAVYAQLKINQ